MRGSRVADDPCPPSRRSRLASRPTQCLLALALSTVALVAASAGRCAVCRRQTASTLHCMRARAITARAPGCAARLGENAAPLWLDAAEVLRQARPGDAGAVRDRALALAGRAAALDRCRFPRRPYATVVGGPIAPPGAAATLPLLVATGRGPVRYGIAAPTGGRFPCAAEVAIVSDLLACAAVHAARAGDMAPAGERLRQGFVLARHLCEEPDAAGVLCAGAVDGAMVGAAAQVLAAADMPVSVALRLTGELGSLGHTAALAKALEAQRQRALCGAWDTGPDGAAGLRGRLVRAADRLSGARDARALRTVADLQGAREALAQPWRAAEIALSRAPRQRGLRA